MNPKTAEIVNEHGDQAYHVAVDFTVLATHIGDTVGADLFAECVRNLMEAGYHKHRKKDERRLWRPNETVRDERSREETDAFAACHCST